MKTGKLFLTMLKLSACTFGGGYVIISLMKEKFVDGGELTGAELADLTALAQSAPGPLAVNAAFLVGRRLGGAKGALAALLGAVLPPLVILSAVSVCYEAIRDFAPVASILRLLRAAVAAVVLDVAVDMAGGFLHARNGFSLAVAALGLAALLAGVNPAILLAACAVVGAGRALTCTRRPVERKA